MADVHTYVCACMLTEVIYMYVLRLWADPPRYVLCVRYVVL